MQARDLWVTIKTASNGSAEGLLHLSLQLWGASDAGTKLGHDQGTREAFVASVVSAALVDTQIEKLALSRDDKEFLLTLNAEAALADLSQFTKSAGLLDTLRAHPALVGAAIGGVSGAGFGAYTDDENRLRGAVRFGVPGAVGGAIVGHGINQMRAEEVGKLEETARNKARDAREVEQHVINKQLLEHKLHQAEAQSQRGWLNNSTPPTPVTP